MTDAAALTAFAGVMALAQFSPGPDLVLVTRTALAQGARAGTWTALGIGTGLIAHATVAMTGVAALLTGGSRLAHGLRLAAAGYLVWLGCQLLRAGWRGNGFAQAPADRPATGQEPSAASAWRRGLCCNLLNPKAALFFAAAAVPLLGPARPPWWPLALGAVIVIQGLVLWIAWSWALQWPPLKSLYQTAARWLDTLCGLALLACAAKVVLW